MTVNEALETLEAYAEQGCGEDQVKISETMLWIESMPDIDASTTNEQIQWH